MSSVEDRFWAKVHRPSPDDCWLWLGAVTSLGFGNFNIGKRYIAAHRYAYELKCGPLPMGARLRRCTATPLCVNPDHLTLDTPSTSLGPVAAEKAAPHSSPLKRLPRTNPSAIARVRAERDRLRESLRQEKIEQRFWSKVQRGSPEECWPWLGTVRRQSGAPAKFWDGERRVNTLHFAYESLHGPVPDGAAVIHACKNPRCVNPHHLILDSVEARFWRHVNKADEDQCWEWNGALSMGYGSFRCNRKGHFAHRFSWELANGPIPPGLFVLHKCDNRRCVNPAHLMVGTHTDNMRDKEAKGRGNHNHGKFGRRLTAEQAAEIRRRHNAGGITIAALAKEYGVSRSNIWAIINNRSFRSDRTQNCEQPDLQQAA